MRLLERVADDEMIAAFLQAEIDSERFGRDVRSCLRPFGRGVSILRTPDTTNSVENGIRREILASFRGYGRNAYLFPGFPANVIWWRAHLSVTYLLEVSYCTHPEWTGLSGGTRKVTDGAAAVRDGDESENARLIRAIAAAIERGKPQAPLILVGKTESGPFVALEGHKRLTAYALTTEFIPSGVDVFVGLSEDIGGWRYF